MYGEVEYATPSRLPLFYLCWRKAVDIGFGFLGVVVLLVLLPLLAPMIYLDSPGPIFFKQERVGYLGKKFRMYKLRSMCRDAEQAGHAIWASKGDPRVTRIGRFLRATHLDELPQALNILRGEMSLIGPRPDREAYVLELERANPLYRRRLAVKPGLTGWSQVNYGYGTACQDELVKLQYDLYYIEHRSLTFDLLILLKTVVEVVLCHGT
jgi:lipopolysaccharide/colanic/teichoic acid biosynthesis glycosyltransferase